MSIETEYISGEGILIFRKRARKKEHGIFVAMAFGSDGDAEFAVRRRDMLPAMYDLSDIKAVCSGELPCRDGACIDPVAILRRKSRSRRGIYKGEIFISAGQERRGCYQDYPSSQSKEEQVCNQKSSLLCYSEKRSASDAIY